MISVIFVVQDLAVIQRGVTGQGGVPPIQVASGGGLGTHTCCGTPRREARVSQPNDFDSVSVWRISLLAMNPFLNFCEIVGARLLKVTLSGTVDVPCVGRAC